MSKQSSLPLWTRRTVFGVLSAEKNQNTTERIFAAYEKRASVYNMIKKAVIFDLDGTLLDTLDDLTDSTNYVLEKYGFETRTKKEIRSFIGNGVAKLIERAVPSGRDNPFYNECVEEFKKYYKSHSTIKTAPYSGITNLLCDLRSRGIAIGVVSNKFDGAVKELCKIYFESLIDCAVGDREGILKKPAPDSVFEAMRILGREKVVYVGDSDVDIKTANNAHIPCISVTWGFCDREKLRENGAEIYADSASELWEKICAAL